MDSKSGLGKAVDQGFDEAVEKVTSALGDVRSRLERVMDDL